MRKKGKMRAGRLILGLVACLGAAGLAALPARAQDIEIEVRRGVVEPLPIAIPGFSGQNARAADIAQVVAADLERSGFFRPIDPARFPAPVADPNVAPNFGEWKAVGSQALVNGAVTVDPDGRLRVDFRLWNVASGQYLVGEQFTAAPESWRRIAHKIADRVYERLTGQKGYFDTRVAFVAESGPRTERKRVLGLMDQDGANPQLLNTGPGQVFTPRFSASSQELTYMALTESGAQLYLYNLESGRRETLGRYRGMVFAPRFSPDGGKVAFSVERGGNSDIYVMDLRSRAEQRLTVDPSIDTSPSFSPDGSRIVFNSDRGGSPQLYIMNADGSGVRRISQGGGRYSTPVWSPRGDYIAFTKQTGNEFHIGVMRVDGSEERLLTTSYLDEGPSWAPNGQVIMFFRETPGGSARLWTVDLTGQVTRPVDYQGSASDPAWSPLLN